jgi:probable HAF family extracellular repeat protein
MSDAEPTARAVAVTRSWAFAALALAVWACDSAPTPTESPGAPSLARAAGAYTVVDLGALPGGKEAGATAIDAAGQVVGWSASPENEQHPFLWKQGSMIDLGTLPGGNPVTATDISSAGQVVGYSASDREDGTGGLAFIWSKGVMTVLGTLGAAGASADAISSSGRLVGTILTAAGEYHAFIRDKGIVTDLGTLGGNFSQAFDINASGQVVGSSVTPEGGSHAFLWENGVMTDLATLGGPSGTATQALAINSKGQVVGTAGQRAFLWQHGVTTDLGTQGGGFPVAKDINDAGQVVGWATVEQGQHAFLWSDGVMIDLGTLPGGSYSRALGINSAGEIVGFSQTATHEQHATLWTRK